MPRSRSLTSSTRGRLPLTCEEDRFAGDWVPILAQLMKAELAERKDRSIACHMKAARFPAYKKDLSGFGFAASEITKRLCASCTAASSWKVRRMLC